MVRRVLRRAGFVPARELTETVARAEERMGDLKRALHAAKKDAQELKETYRARSEKHAQLETKFQKERAQLETKFQERLAKWEQEVAKLRARDADRAAGVEEMKATLRDALQKIAWAEKTTQLGREHLMAIEVKLDIVEGAIKVLDQRTRAALESGRYSRESPRVPARLP